MEINKATKSKKVYHICGSPTSDFFFELSMIYSRGVICPPGWRQSFIVIKPDNKWFCGENLDLLTSREVTQILASLEKDALIVPHMFCKSGMTLYRYFFHEQLGFPMVGSSAETMKISMDKNLTRNLVSQNGVTVAPGELLRYGERPSISYPFMVKPNSEDNSSGVSLVEDEKTLDHAMEVAFNLDSEVLVEAFIPGRELRIAVIELNNGFYVPSIIEYPVSEKHPIRRIEDKLEIDEKGLPNRQASISQVGPICPAKIEEQIFSDLSAQAIRAHKSLNARHFSLFDFRLDNRNGQVVFLEAGLFWSFSEASMISKMIKCSENSLTDIIDQIWNSAKC
ncbi:D-alanine--D-alanine ligase [Pseudomonadota bacterium]|nr:D-alanine--D-alanine ligase [Pseudomonadota bacterium]